MDTVRTGRLAGRRGYRLVQGGAASWYRTSLLEGLLLSSVRAACPDARRRTVGDDGDDLQPVR